MDDVKEVLDRNLVLLSDVEDSLDCAFRVLDKMDW